MMYRLEELINEYSISKELLENFVESEKIKISKNGTIVNEEVNKVLNFIEQQDDRLNQVINNSDPFYSSDDGMVTIYNNDVLGFLRSLPNNCIDMIVTDPAYSGMNNKLKLGNGRIVGQYSDKGTENGKWFSEFEDNIENFTLFLTECKRVLRKTTGHIYIMFDSFSLLSLGPLVRDFFDVKNLITWDKVNIGMGHYFRRRHEYIIFSTNDNTRKIRNRKFPDVWRFKRIHNAKYPTQKPVELFQAMIYASANENFTVCDPFLGSGSAAIAARKNNCRFIGCDISEKALEISSNRIRNYFHSGEDSLQPKSAAVDDNCFWE